MQPSADVMEVEYEITPGDLYAFQFRVIQRSPVAKRARRSMYLYLLLAVAILTIVPAIGPGGFDVSRVSLGFFVGFFAFVAALSWFFEKRLTPRAIRDLIKEEKPDKGQLGRHTVKLDEAGVVESTVVGQLRASWAGIDRVEEDSDYIFIYTAAAAALLIPRRAFGSAEEADRFFQMATAGANGATR